MGLESPIFYKIINLSIIVFGIGLTSLGEIRFEFVGFLLQIFALFFEAFRLAFTQKLLKDDKYKMDPLVSLYYFAPCCAGLICMEGVTEDEPDRRMERDYMGGSENCRCWTMYVEWTFGGRTERRVGALGESFLKLHFFAWVLLKLETQIGKTSSLIFPLCGVVKNIILIGTSAYYEGTVITPMQYFGSSVVSVGLVYYNLGGEKVREIAEKARWSELYDDKWSTGRSTATVSLIVGCAGFIVVVVVWYGVDLDLRGHLP